jgi:hypothetical protein
MLPNRVVCDFVISANLVLEYSRRDLTLAGETPAKKNGRSNRKRNSEKANIE